MAFLADIVTIRDQLVSEFKAEMTRRAALVAAGHPPPTDASMGGKSVQWNAYVTTMTAQIKEWNAFVIAAGGEGIPEQWMKVYT